MEGCTAYDALAKIEQILCEAETRAISNARQHQFVCEDNAAYARLSDQPLVSAAKRELERRRLRTRYLPAGLTDTCWAILLDLFACNQLSQELPIAGCGIRWGVSDATAARQIAVLIETNLVARVRGRDEQHHDVVRLTAEGHNRLDQILELYLKAEALPG